MLLIFKILFITGILYALISIILGNLFEFGDFDGIDGDFPILSALPISPVNVIIFITTLGGVGIMQIKAGKESLDALIIAFLVATIVSFLIYRFVIYPLKKSQNTSSISQKELIGHEAVVTKKILKNGFGQISYTEKGNSYTSPAKSIDKEEIEIGNKVIIVTINNGIFIVKKVDDKIF